MSKHRANGVASNLKTGDNISPKPDRRGRYTTRANKIPAEILAQIDEHIKSFPRRRLHYSKSDNQKRY